MIRKSSKTTTASSKNGNSAKGKAYKIPLSLEIDLVITDAEVIQAICSQPSGQPREMFTTNALRLGVLAMNSAAGEVDTQRIQNEVNRMLESLQASLAEHGKQVDNNLAAVLKQYFDPRDGRVTERLDRLVQDGGELDTLLGAHIGEDHSGMARTLAGHIGEESPIFKLLSPDQSKGLLATLEERIAGALTAQKEAMLAEFSLDNKEGALARFLAEVEECQAGLTSDLKSRVDLLAEELSLDNKKSALSRMSNMISTSHEQITKQFSLDAKDSALARLRSELLAVIREQSDAAADFQGEVKSSLAVLDARREEMEAGTRHGGKFEDDVYRLIQAECKNTGDLVEQTGAKVGSIRNCKKGDVVIELGPEKAAAGARIVVEAKQRKNFSLVKAREEIEQARKNRSAQIGIFVFSSRTAPEGQPVFERIGEDIFVTWDAANPSTDLLLTTAVTLAQGLCAKQATSTLADDLDLQAIEKAILEIEKQAENLAKIMTWTETISSNCEKIAGTISTSRKSLKKQVRVLGEQLEIASSVVE